MEVKLIAQTNQPGIDNAQVLTWRSERLLARFRRQIRALIVRLHDANGPKGGVDRECKVTLELDDGRVLHAKARSEIIPAAIEQALRRVVRGLIGSRQRTRSLRRRALA